MFDPRQRCIRLVLCAACFALTGASAAADAIDDYVREEMEKACLPGLALAVTRGGEVIKIAGYGFGNLELQTPVTPATVFQIQSITKQFVATAIMMLADEGRLSVDDKLSAHLDHTPDCWQSITLRHLLTHTSGIKDFINEPTADLRLEVTDDEVFAATAARPLNFEPGDKYAYSNSNYHLLAMIIKKLTGEPYGTFLKRRVFQPLGMRHTQVMTWSEIVPNRAAGYRMKNRRQVNGEFVAGSILAYGGGGLLSTVQDMAKWDLALQGETLLKRATLDRMWSRPTLNNGALSNYGFGWAISGAPPHRFVHHAGEHITGFTSAIVRCLDDDLSVIVLVNAGYGNPEEVAKGVAALYIPELNPPKREATEKESPT